LYNNGYNRKVYMFILYNIILLFHNTDTLG